MLKLMLDRWGVVLSGHWNRMIFSPVWVSEKVFATGDVTVEVPVNSPLGPLRFTAQDVRLIVAPGTPGRLTLFPASLQTGVLEHIEEIALRILETLPHTPVFGAGINFHYVEEDPPESLLALFKLADDNELADRGFALGQRTITRRLTKEDLVLNLSLELRGTAVSIGFNYHRDTTTTTAAMEYIRDRMRRCRETTEDLLKEVLRLQIARGYDDD